MARPTPKDGPEPERLVALFHPEETPFDRPAAGWPYMGSQAVLMHLLKIGQFPATRKKHRNLRFEKTSAMEGIVMFLDESGNSTPGSEVWS